MVQVRYLSVHDVLVGVGCIKYVLMDFNQFEVLYFKELGMKCFIFNPQISYDTFITFHRTGEPATIIRIAISSLRVRLAKFYYQASLLK